MTAAHLHLIVNHLPIFGSLFAVGFLAVAALRRGAREWLLPGVLLLGLGGLGAPIAVWTGEEAEEQIEHLPGVSERDMDEHEERGETAGFVGWVSLALAAILGWVGLRRPATARMASLVLFVAAVALSAASAWTALAGGPIRHPEVRAAGAAGGEGAGEGAAAQERADDDDDDDDD